MQRADNSLNYSTWFDSETTISCLYCTTSLSRTPDRGISIYKTFMDTKQILSNKKASILIVEERNRKAIVIGAPHHSPGGVRELPCPEHPYSDENTGLIALQIAEQLSLSSIIACNYRIDPNKNLGTDYAMQIAAWSPKYLIEIHGHGARKINNNKIEISCGTPERSNLSTLFAKTLQTKLTLQNTLSGYEVNGEFESLHFKASKTATIIDQRWIPFHIELPPSLRINTGDNLPDFILALIETINEVCI